MQVRGKIFFCLIFASVHLFAKNGIGADVCVKAAGMTVEALHDLGEAALKASDNMAKTVEALSVTAEKTTNVLAPAIAVGGSNFGKNFGLASVSMLVKAGGKVAVTVKATGTAVVTAPAFPYVAGGAMVVAGGYGGYRVYQYFHPSADQRLEAERAKVLIQKLRREQEAFAIEEELNKSLLGETSSPRNKAGVPVLCQAVACKYALVAGKAKADEKMNAYAKYAPAA